MFQFKILWHNNEQIKENTLVFHYLAMGNKWFRGMNLT